MSSSEASRMFCELIPTVCEFLGREELQTTCYLILAWISRSYSDTAMIVSYFDKYDIFTRAVHSFVKICSESNHPEKSNELLVQSDAVIDFILVLASHAPMAERLFSHRIMNFLTDSSSVFFKNIAEPYRQEQRNPAHRIWCKVIQTVTSMNQSLKHNEQFVQVLIHFSAIHHYLLFDQWAELDHKPSVEFSLAKIEEIRWVSAFVSELASIAPKFPGKQLLEIHKNIVLLMQHYILSLLKSSEAVLVVHPVTKPERKDARTKPQISSAAEKLPANKVPSSPLLTSSSPGWLRSSVGNAKDDLPGSKFQQEVEGHMYQTISNSLVFIRKVCPKIWSWEFEIVDNHVPLFTPFLAAPSVPQYPPCLGVLLLCVTLCTRGIYKGESTLGPLLRFNIENALGIVLLQISLYLRKYPSPQAKFELSEQLGFELRAFLERILANLPETDSPTRSFLEYVLNCTVAMLEL
jgi:hypothetical protein